MTTLNIHNTLRNFGVHSHHGNEATTHQGPGILNRLAANANVWAGKYATYKYNETYWSSFRI